MNISLIIMCVMAVFMLIGVFDKIVLKNKYGYGSEFDEGMLSMGQLATAMVGFMCIAPVIGRVLTPLVAPFFHLFGADPAMLAGSILAIDMGGFPLAVEMTNDFKIAVFSGGLYASMMGACITFAIPVALSTLTPEDNPYLAKGVMAGVIVTPVSCLVGGLLLGLSLKTVVVNLIPGIILAVLLTLGLIFIPNKLMKGFNGFSKFLTVFLHIALAIAIFSELTGVVIIKGMAPIGPQLETMGIIAITLAGAYPFVRFITKTFKKPLEKFGHLLGVNDVTIGGMIACLANSLPMLNLVKNMNERGKVISIAFMVPAAFVFGDHLAYASVNMPEYIMPLVVTKLMGGVLAVLLALFMTKKMDKKG